MVFYMLNVQFLIQCYQILQLFLLELKIAEQKDEPATERLAVMSNLAMVYKDSGQMSKAETLLLECLQICEEHIPEGDNAHLRTLNNLAAYYVADEDYDKAESYMVKALRGCEETLGPEDPKTIVSMNNLAHVYKEQERIEEALAYLDEQMPAIGRGDVLMGHSVGCQIWLR